MAVLAGFTSDVLSGWRQITKFPALSAAAILSLTIAVSAATTSFRLLDGMFLRILPVAHADKLYFVTTFSRNSKGLLEYTDLFDYPRFVLCREAVSGAGKVLLVGTTSPQEVKFNSASESEKFQRQYVSGNMFGVFGLRPALGRLILPPDDLASASPVAVLSYDYWERRFGRDRRVIGQTFEYQDSQFEIIGVGPKGFIGTEPGLATDIFVPASTNKVALNKNEWRWFRIWVEPDLADTTAQVQQRLQAGLLGLSHTDTNNASLNELKTLAYSRETIRLFPASHGVSNVKNEYGKALIIIGCLVGLLLLVTCLNVSNLIAAQTFTRSKEMAVRTALGASRWKLIRLGLLENTLMASLSGTGGFFLSWFAMPLILRVLLPSEEYISVPVENNWHIYCFVSAAVVLVTFASGLVPALRASDVKPLAAFRSGERESARQGVMSVMVMAQMALCVFMLFVTGLFVTSVSRLTSRPLGFSARRVFAIDSEYGEKAPAAVWMETVGRLRAIPGVSSAAVAGWALLTGNTWTTAIRTNNQTDLKHLPYVLDVSQGFFNVMEIQLVSGRDFRVGDVQPQLGLDGLPKPGVGIVNDSFARVYFGGKDPVGRFAEVQQADAIFAPMVIIGCVRDNAYSRVREPFQPIVYVPLEDRAHSTILVRTKGDQPNVIRDVRNALAKASSQLRIRTIQGESELAAQQTIQERLLADLSMFFAVFALMLAGVGLYGVLNYSVSRQRKQIGVRMALGASSLQIVQGVMTKVAFMLLIGVSVGLVGGIACGHIVEALLYEVRATDVGVITGPVLLFLGVAIVSAVPPTIRAVMVEPASSLRID